MTIAGSASTSRTAAFRQRFASSHPAAFRSVQDVSVSSIGVGTYLGESDDRTDALYGDAIRAAVSHGCNVFDTAINYRCQRSERTIGRTLDALIQEHAIAREEIFLCTKGGYLPFDGVVPADPARMIVETIIDPGLASYDEIIAGCHCLSPRYLHHALTTSLANLRMQTIDCYYLHNPEQQLDEISREQFLQRLDAAFTVLEEQARRGTIRWYGVATWHGFRVAPQAKNYLSLEKLAGIAQRAGGSSHHFRMIQLPYNLAMPEAYTFANQMVEGTSLTLLQAAQRLGIAVMISASLLQGQLARLSPALANHIPGLATSAQRAIQFVRSTPGVTTALIGMKTRGHVEENLAVFHHPPLEAERLAHLFDRAHRSSSASTT